MKNIIKILFVFVVFLNFDAVYADGSKDLYPNGVQGGRAKLRASTLVAAEAVPFPTLGRHYVYAVAGEQIAMASSVQNMGSGRIRITRPNGTSVTSGANNQGQISTVHGISGITTNRLAELGGPRLPASGSGGGYIPWVHIAETTGIYMVEFISGLGEFTVDEGSSTTDPGRSNTAANANWTQSASTIYINAWDISVSNAAGNQWISGRVYANVLNMDIFSINTSPLGFSNVGGFYGRLYVLTKDGYVYRVNNNGNNGITFTFFSNNNGFIDEDNEPTYLSQNSALAADFTHDPRSADANNNITNKIFYTVPDANMPEVATGSALPGGSTWLMVERIPPEVYDVKVIGYDGTEGQVSNKGGHFYFETDNLASRYTIQIMPPLDNPGLFVTRTLTGPAQEGENWVPWDGKDGVGDDLPPGLYEPQVGIALQTAEVHFPYIDMEINPNGIIIELLDKDNPNEVEQDIVYWNDTLIPTGGVQGSISNPINASHTEDPDGENSTTSGHRWGASTTAVTGTFGDVKSMDTWTFVDGEMQIETPQIFVAQSDVETVSIVSSHDGVVSVGDTWNYTVEVRNNGSMEIKTNTDPEEGLLTGPASFMLYVPSGISINPAMVTFSSPCGVVIMETPTFVDGIYTAKLDMPVDCIATFTIPVTAVEGVQTGNGDINVWATMLRPDDFTDTDATNPFPDKKPEDPFFEADGIQTAVDDGEGGGLGDTLFLDPDSIDFSQSNNIKLNNQPYMFADMAVTKAVDPPSDYSAYQQIVFTITATNNGDSDATNVQVTDVLTSSYGYVSQTPSKGSYDPNTGIWTIGTLEKDDVETLELTVVIQGGDQQTNTATIEAAEYDPNLSNNESNEITTDAVFETDVEIVKTGFRTGDDDGNATFTLTVRNNGPVIATNVVVTDDLTTRYDFVDPASNHTVSHGSASWTGTQNQNITWTIGTLLVNETAVMTFTAVNNATGDRSNTASVTITENDIAPSNNSSTLVEPPFTGAPVDLAIQKTVDNTSPTVGSLVEFTITLTRISGGLTTGVVVTDLLPNGYAYNSHTASQGSYNKVNGKWSVGIIDSNTPRTLVIEAYVKMPSNVPDEYKNIAAITHSSQGDNNPTNNIANAVVVPNIIDLAISKIVDESNPGVGEQVVFTIEVTNNGPANATGVVVYDKLPSGYTWVSDDSSEAYTPGTGIWTIGNLTSGASINIDITVEVNPTGQYLNKAEVYGNQQETDYTNNSAEVQTTPDCIIRNISPNVIKAP